MQSTNFLVLLLQTDILHDTYKDTFGERVFVCLMIQLEGGCKDAV